jgi:chemotaxis protein CheD
VSIIFYNSGKNISAVCHAQLPREMFDNSCKDSCPNPCGLEESDKYKYVTCSFKYMITFFHKLGIQNKEIEVSLYGGANMINLGSSLPPVGKMNIETAKELISKNKLPIKNEDTAGTCTRVLTHYSDTGITSMKKIKKLSDNFRQSLVRPGGLDPDNS